LLGIAREHNPGFAPFLAVLFATGMRRGEALGLQWVDIDFESRILTIRRAIGNQGQTTPKSGRARRIPMTQSLAQELFDVLAAQREEGLRRGWPEPSHWVFCTESGGPRDPRNVERSWRGVRRVVASKGVRPLKLHAARHTWATLALQAGKSIRW